MLNWILKLTAKITAWVLMKKWPKHPVERTEEWVKWKNQLSQYIKA